MQIRTHMGSATCVAVLAMSTFFATNAAQAERILGLGTSGELVVFDSSAPGTVLNSTTIQGLSDGEVLRGLDARPRDGQVYGIVTNANGTGRLVTIDPFSGMTSSVANLISGGGNPVTGGGSPTTPIDPQTPAIIPADARASLDFNPVVDLLRTITDQENNFRTNPGNRVAGGVAGTTATDVSLTVTAPGVSGPVDAVGTAYNNNNDGVASTVQYVIDAVGDRLLIQAPPNAGTLSTFIGLLTIEGMPVEILDAGFDISGMTGIAYAVFDTLTDDLTNALLRVDLANGQLSNLGFIGDDLPFEVLDLTVLRNVPEPATLALFGLGLAGAAIARRQAKKQMSVR
jgi:Domain of unknown function (DUF4394)/PEP-CTERM motif